MQTVDSKELTRGRPLGKGNLPEAVKLDILKEKKLHIISQSEIAQKHGIARRTVNVLTEDSLSPESKKQLETFTQRLTKARDKTLERIQEKLDADLFKTGEYSGLFQTLNTNHRLETGQSTVNVAITAQAQVLHKWIETHNPPLAEIEEYIELTADAQNVNANELRTELDRYRAAQLDTPNE